MGRLVFALSAYSLARRRWLWTLVYLLRRPRLVSAILAVNGSKPCCALVVTGRSPTTTRIGNAAKADRHVEYSTAWRDGRIFLMSLQHRSRSHRPQGGSRPRGTFYHHAAGLGAAYISPTLPTMSAQIDLLNLSALPIYLRQRTRQTRLDARGEYVETRVEGRRLGVLPLTLSGRGPAVVELARGQEQADARPFLDDEAGDQIASVDLSKAIAFWMPIKAMHRQVATAEKQDHASQAEKQPLLQGSRHKAIAKSATKHGSLQIFVKRVGAAQQILYRLAFDQSPLRRPQSTSGKSSFCPRCRLRST